MTPHPDAGIEAAYKFRLNPCPKHDLLGGAIEALTVYAVQPRDCSRKSVPQLAPVEGASTPLFRAMRFAKAREGAYGTLINTGPNINAAPGCIP